MIIRMWHGKTHISMGDEYMTFLAERAIPDYRSIAGNLGVRILRRDAGDEAHFITLTQWDSFQSIRNFAGARVETAKYYPEDSSFLLEFEPDVVHYEVVAEESQGAGARDALPFDLP